MSEIRSYTFRRRAKNESNSGRTAKLGTWKSTLPEAVDRAHNLAAIHDTTIAISDTDTDMNIAWVSKFSVSTTIEVLSSHFKEIIP